VNNEPAEARDMWGNVIGHPDGFGEIAGEEFSWRYDRSAFVFGNIAAGEAVEVTFHNISGNDVTLRPTLLGAAMS
jgi:hypothetical protein